MADPKLDRLIRRFHNLARALGPDAFSTRTSVVLYSGPPNEVVSAVGLDTQIRRYRNHKVSEGSAVIFDATRIDDTAIGKILFRPDKDIYQVLSKIYGADGLQYADKINREFSKLFASHAAGQVFTVVCGASRNRVFCEEELPAIIGNRRVMQINGIDADLVRDQFQINAERAYRRVTQSEQRLTYGIAQNLGTADAFLDYAERRDFRRADRELIRDQAGNIVPGQSLPGATENDRRKFVEAKLQIRKERTRLGLHRPWRSHVLAGTGAHLK